MTRVFISGSIKIRHLEKEVIERLKKIVASNFCVIIGDAGGVDSSVQAFLKEQGADSVIVYCSGAKPRNNLGPWGTKNVTATAKPGTREFFTAKDKSMAEDCDYGFMVWDAASTGTLSNALELLRRKKPALVFVNKTKQFLTIKSARDFESLLALMSDAARELACEKIEMLSHAGLGKFSQHDLFASSPPAGLAGSHSTTQRQRVR